MSFLEAAEKVIDEVDVSDVLTWTRDFKKLFIGLVDELKRLNTKVDKIVEQESLILVQKNTTDLLVKENKRLSAQVNNLNDRVNKLEDIVDHNEQHDRNINLVLHGVAEKNGENTTDEFVNSLNQ